MRTRLSGAVLGLAALLAPGSQANDSEASLGAGGIALKKSDDIRMLSEDLFVSPEKVRVRYEFLNESDKDITTTVAFPLPDVDSRHFWGAPIGTVSDNPINFVDFAATVDGRRVLVRAEQHARHKGEDVTAQIRGAGLPVNITIAGGPDRPASAWRKLTAAGLAEDAGDGHNFLPLWSVETTLYWTQTFPARRAVTVEHRYQPVTGSFFYTGAESDRNERHAFCIDSPTRSAIAKRLSRAAKKSGSEGMLVASQTDYILSTAMNWKGSIGTFHLTLDKLDPDAILSLCWQGKLRKTGPTLFEFSARDFVPERDISLLVLRDPAP
jgi:hypothetical protein